MSSHGGAGAQGRFGARACLLLDFAVYFAPSPSRESGHFPDRRPFEASPAAGTARYRSTLPECRYIPHPDAGALVFCSREYRGRHGPIGVVMKIAQVSPLFESVPPSLYGGFQRIVSLLTGGGGGRGHDGTLIALRESQRPARLVPVTQKA